MSFRAPLSLAAVIATPVFAIALGARVASAQERPETTESAPPRAARDAIEVAIGGGVTSGAGDISEGAPVRDVARTGGAVSIEVGYRFNPRFMFGAYGTYGHSDAAPNVPPDAHVREVTVGLQGQFHFLPNARLDPWIGLGAGYRALAVVPDGLDTTGIHDGVQIARVRVGLDYRIARSVALGPVLGADATMFVSQRPVGGNDVHAIPTDALAVSTFFFGGLAGRFDIDGSDDTMENQIVGPRAAASR